MLASLPEELVEEDVALEAVVVAELEERAEAADEVAELEALDTAEVIEAARLLVLELLPLVAVLEAVDAQLAVVGISETPAPSQRDWANLIVAVS